MEEGTPPVWENSALADPGWRNLDRRHFLRSAVGVTLGSLPFLSPDLMRAALGADGTRPAPSVRETPRGEAEAMLLLWLEGGPGNDDLWNPQDKQPWKGPFERIQTKIPGHGVTELWPGVAASADKLSFVNCLCSSTTDHFKSSDEVLCPDGVTTLAKDVALAKMEAYSKIRPVLPEAFWWMNGTFQPDGSHQVEKQAFRFNDDGNGAFGAPPGGDTDTSRTSELLDLTRRLESASPNAIHGRIAKDVVAYRELAGAVITGNPEGLSKALVPSERLLREFREPDDRLTKAVVIALQYLESGGGFATVHDSRFSGWDRHDSVTRFAELAPAMDDAIATIVRLIDNGTIRKRVMFLCMGEFARTPKINDSGGRDHWNKGFGAIWGGHGVRKGVIVGGAYHGDVTGEHPPIPVDWTIRNTAATILGMKPPPSSVPQRVISEIIDDSVLTNLETARK